MKKLLTILAVALCNIIAMAQTNQYFWAGGQFIMGNPIDQIDSVTFGELEQTDSILLYLPRTIKVVHDTIIQYVTIHDTINPCIIPDGAIGGKFSVSDSLCVYFSKGNLQFNAAQGTHKCADGTTKQGTWRFAEHQYDAIGADNANRSATYNGWIDLFCCGTSGWNSGAVCYEPWARTPNNSNYQDFYIGGASSNDAVGQYENADWGIYNAISNGGDEPQLWRLLSEAEMEYLFTKRKNANQLYSRATVNNMSGLIILPDNWENISNISFAPLASNFSTNTYDIDTWAILEKNGAIFLPAAGQCDCYRGDYCFGTVGWYWSSTVEAIVDMYGITFDEIQHVRYNAGLLREMALSVRLVQNIK